MESSKIADILASLDIINRHDAEGTFATYSVKPHGKMSFLAEEIIVLPTVVDDVRDYCVKAGYFLRLSHKGGIYHTDDDGNDTLVTPGKYICIVEKVWVTVENEDCNRAIVEACAKALQREMK